MNKIIDTYSKIHAGIKHMRTYGEGGKWCSVSLRCRSLNTSSLTLLLISSYIIEGRGYGEANAIPYIYP